MSDQVTTVASLPSGYTTLAGVIYAVSATTQPSWKYVGWRKFVPFDPRRDRESLLLSELELGTDASDVAMHRRLINTLSNLIAKESRALRGLPSEGQRLETLVAALHIARISYAQAFQSYDTLKGRCSKREPQSTLCCQPSPCECIGVPPSENSTWDSSPRLPAVTVHVVDEKEQHTHQSVSITTNELRTMILDAVSSRKSAEIDTITTVVEKIVSFAQSPGLTSDVYVQAASTEEAFVVECAYKAIEILISISVVLGSTGGAWLGLTFGSMYPQRFAAGVYVSSYGQVLNSQELPDGRYWRPVGTVWAGSEEHLMETSLSYEILPAGVIPDRWRDAIGHWIQFGLLATVQQYKLAIRDILQFSEYLITRDGVRYVVLVILVCALLVCCVAKYKDWKRHNKTEGEGRGPKPVQNLNIIAMLVYIVMLAGGLACVILGQGPFLKPIWKFYFVSKIVDWIALVGSMAVMSVDWGLGIEVHPVQWTLLWVLGTCTVVW